MEESDQLEEKEITETEKYVDPLSYWMVKEREVTKKILVPKINNINKDICEDYLRNLQDFQIYQENRLLFDSSTTDISNINFFDDHFNLYGKEFKYKGIKIVNL